MSCQTFNVLVAVGFGLSESFVTVSEGDDITTTIGILQPMADQIDPGASLPISLVLQRENELEGAA